MFQYRFIFILLILGSQVVHAQVFPDKFGKNRVQYHDRFENWSYYETEHFISYWYGNGRNIAEQAAVLAELEISRVEKIIEYRLNEKIDLVVYNDLTDLHQSNIGNEEVFNTSNNRFQILNKKMFVYNTGKIHDLRKQIREGIATILVNYNLYGENLKEILQNSLFEDLPVWFKPGLIAYCGRAWDTDLDNQIRHFITTQDQIDFDILTEQDEELAGHSFWHFISSVYGEQVISNLLYLIRINSNANESFQYVLELNLTDLKARWKNFYTHQYRNYLTQFDWDSYIVLDEKLKKDESIQGDAWNLTTGLPAFSTDQFGKKRVYILQRSNNRALRIFKSGKINKLQRTDLDYPVLDWTPSGNALLIVYERKDEIYYRHWDATKKKLGPEMDFAPQIDRVLSLDHWSETEIVLSGLRKGHADLFFFNTSSGQLRTITNDFFYDDQVRIDSLHGQKGIFFSSDRFERKLDKKSLDSILTLPGNKLYFLNPDQDEAIQLSSSFHSNTTNGIGLDSFRYLSLSDISGINNLQQGRIDRRIDHYQDSLFLKNGDIEIIDPAVENSYDTSLVDHVIRMPVYRWEGDIKPLRGVNFNITSIEVLGSDFLITMNQGEKMKFYRIPQTDFLGNPENRMTEFAIQRASQNIHFNPEFDKTSEPNTKKKKQETKKSNEVQTEQESFFFQSKFDRQLEKEEPNDSEKKDNSNGFTPLQEENDSLVHHIDSLELMALDVEEETNKSNETQPILAFFDTDLSQYQDTMDQRLYIGEAQRFRQSKIIPYRLKFRVESINSDLENTPLVTGMETFLSGEENNFFNPLGITFRATAQDLLEDYIIEAGLRFPTSFNGQEYFLSFENRKRQLDKKFVFYRRTTKETRTNAGTVEEKNKLITSTLLNQLKYPTSIFGSLRLTTYVRTDRQIFRAVEQNTLARNELEEQRVGSRIEYVYDNTYDIDINMKGGMRYRVFIEGIKKLNIDYRDDFTYRGTPGISTIFGVDFRYYQPVLKHSILAFRGAGAISDGYEKVLFYLGGSRNWLIPQFDNSIPLPADRFSFYSIASNVRGFKYNARNGTSFALTNLEWRVPIFKYFTKKSIRSNFLRSFQLVGFFDAGKSWNGYNPFDNSPIESSVTIQNNEYVRLDVSFFRDQFIMGYGTGVRAQIFGYFIRLDYGRGIESGEVLPNPVWHLSLGTDF